MILSSVMVRRDNYTQDKGTLKNSVFYNIVLNVQISAGEGSS